MQHGVQIGQLRLRHTKGGAHAAAEEPDDGHQERNRNQGQERQLRAQVDENARDPRQHRDVDDEVGDVVRDERLDVGRVVDDPGHNFARLLVAVVAQRKFLQMVVQRHPQVAHVIPRHDVGHVALEILEHAPQHIRGQERQGQHADPVPHARPLRVTGDDVGGDDTDDFSQQPRPRQAEHGDGQCRDEDDGHMKLVRRQKAAKPGKYGHEQSPRAILHDSCRIIIRDPRRRQGAAQRNQKARLRSPPWNHGPHVR